MFLCKKLTRIAIATVIAFYATVGVDSALAADEIIVNFRLTKWKSAHFNDAGKAKGHYDTLKRLGCEAKQGAHKGHFDVSYQSLTWRRLSFKTDSEAHQWAHWLDGNGFEIVFAQPAQSGHLQTISYKLPEWTSGHFDQAPQAESQSDTLRMLGCEVKQGSHAGHHDVSYRCSQTRVIGVENHDEAHRWEKWLQANGFETQHAHKTASQGTAPSRRR